jgi:hypothetical protein
LRDERERAEHLDACRGTGDAIPSMMSEEEERKSTRTHEQTNTARHDPKIYISLERRQVFGAYWHTTESRHSCLILKVWPKIDRTKVSVDALHLFMVRLARRTNDELITRTNRYATSLKLYFLYSLGMFAGRKCSQ